MLRITQPEGPTPRLVVEGVLTGRYVDELRAACARVASDGRPLALALDGLSYLDARGIALLEELAMRGVRLLGGSAFVREILRRIPAVADPRAPAHGPDAVLLAALGRGEASAQEELVRRFGPRLLAVARRLLPAEADAAQALRETFWQAFDTAAELDEATALEPWLHRLVVETALRRRGDHNESPELADDLQPRFTAAGVRVLDEADQTLALEGPGAHLEALAPEVRELVRESVDELPEPERTILVLCDIEGFGLAEAARLLGVDAAATRACLHRARQTLRGLLGRSLAARERSRATLSSRRL